MDDGLADDVKAAADFLGCLLPVLGGDTPLAEVLGYLDAAKDSGAQLAVLRHALAAQQVQVMPGKGPGMRPAVGR